MSDDFWASALIFKLPVQGVLLLDISLCVLQNIHLLFCQGNMADKACRG